MDYQTIIDKFYPENNALRHILLVHSRSVADKALAIAGRHPELKLDRQFIEEAAMLHDIGIVRCNAPAIQCFGSKPYICHGYIGAGMLLAEGFPRHARVCERHTGAGILQETMEEKLICYADKFFSKTRLDHEKTLEEAEASLAKFGEEGIHRFRQWERMFR